MGVQLHSTQNEVPEMTISENVKLTGTISFKRLFRIDGSVDGKVDAPKDVSHICYILHWHTNIYKLLIYFILIYLRHH